MLTSIPSTLSIAGLVVASVMSCTNVFMEVARKQAVRGRPLLPVLFWAHVFDALVFGAALLIKQAFSPAMTIQNAGSLFGITGVHLSPLLVYCVYLVIDLMILGVANWLFFRALQVSSLSYSVPFLAFTSVLIVPAAFLILRELPNIPKLLGVFLTVAGSVVMNRRCFSAGWFAPVRAIYHDKGSRYMLGVALLLAVSSPLDKRLVLMTDVFRQSLVYGIGMCVFFLVLCMVNREQLGSVIRMGIWWIALAGTLDAASLLLQFQAYRYLDVVIAVSIKRAGIVLSVLFGWFFFHEKDIPDRLVASSVMFIGVLILYLPVTVGEAIATALVTLTAMFAALRYIRVREVRSESAPGDGAALHDDVCA